MLVLHFLVLDLQANTNNFMSKLIALESPSVNQDLYHVGRFES